MKEQVVEILNNELAGYIIEVVTIFCSVIGGMFLLVKKVKELYEKAVSAFKTAHETTEKTNSNLEAVTKDNQAVRLEVKEIEERIFARLEAVERKQQEQNEEQKEILQSYIEKQSVLLKLPEAFAEMVKNDSKQVRTGVAKRICDKLGLNDTTFDKVEAKATEVENTNIYTDTNGGE